MRSRRCKWACKRRQLGSFLQARRETQRPSSAATRLRTVKKNARRQARLVESATQVFHFPPRHWPLCALQSAPSCCRPWRHTSHCCRSIDLSENLSCYAEVVAVANMCRLVQTGGQHVSVPGLYAAPSLRSASHSGLAANLGCRVATMQRLTMSSVRLGSATCVHEWVGRACLLCPPDIPHRSGGFTATSAHRRPGQQHTKVERTTAKRASPKR